MRRMDGALLPVRAHPPLVSVIIVVWNGAATLERALRSVFAQDRTLVECVVIDGASTDGTLEILERLSPSIDRWQSEPDGGIYDAMNKGAALARGSFLYFLGRDDELLIDIASLRPYLTDTAAVCYGNVIALPSRRIYDGPFSAWKLARRNICHQAIFYPAHIVRAYGFTPRYRTLADWELNLRCFNDKALRFQHIPHVIASFSLAGASAQTRDHAFEQDRSALYRRYLPRPVYTLHRIRRLLGRSLRSILPRQLLRRTPALNRRLAGSLRGASPVGVGPGDPAEPREGTATGADARNPPIAARLVQYSGHGAHGSSMPCDPDFTRQLASVPRSQTG